MIITLQELWDRVMTYPERFSYYDKKSESNGIIFDKREIDAFVEINGDRLLYDFEIDNMEKSVYVAVDNKE